MTFQEEVNLPILAKCPGAPLRLPPSPCSNTRGVCGASGVQRACARPVHLIITMIQWIRTSKLSIKNSLSSCAAQLQRDSPSGWEDRISAFLSFHFLPSFRQICAMATERALACAGLRSSYAPPCRLLFCVCTVFHRHRRNTQDLGVQSDPTLSERSNT